MKIAVGGGVPSPITEDGSLGFLSWGVNDMIVYSNGANIKKISANGGDTEVLIESTGFSLAHPQILPDGKNILFTAMSAEGEQLVVQSPESESWKELITGDTSYYLPTGHIVYGLEKLIVNECV